MSDIKQCEDKCHSSALKCAVKCIDAHGQGESGKKCFAEVCAPPFVHCMDNCKPHMMNISSPHNSNKKVMYYALAAAVVILGGVVAYKLLKKK